MKSVLVKPGHTVTDVMYRAAKTALRKHMPDVMLTWDKWIDPKSWDLLPDPSGFGYRAEFEIIKEKERTGKFNVWYGPDLRDGEKPKPHDHPWPFKSYILIGGYVEIVYWVVDGKVLQKCRVHKAGSVNEMPLHTFHEVTAVQPGTLTFMHCERGQKTWGYLDVVTGEFTEHQSDATFKRNKARLNPV